jgi:hypothetical protein
MASIYKSAMGKSVDMGSIMSKNEKTRAVSNVKNLNARGDTIDAFGKIVKPVTEKVNNAYSKTVGNRSAQVKPKPTIQPDLPKPVKIEEEEIVELTTEELELDEDLEYELEVEKIKQAELKAKAAKKK